MSYFYDAFILYRQRFNVSFVQQFHQSKKLTVWLLPDTPITTPSLLYLLDTVCYTGSVLQYAFCLPHCQCTRHIFGLDKVWSLIDPVKQ
jgi:hypothetical protein